MLFRSMLKQYIDLINQEREFLNKKIDNLKQDKHDKKGKKENDKDDYENFKRMLIDIIQKNGGTGQHVNLYLHENIPLDTMKRVLSDFFTNYKTLVDLIIESIKNYTSLTEQDIQNSNTIVTLYKVYDSKLKNIIDQSKKNEQAIKDCQNDATVCHDENKELLKKKAAIIRYVKRTEKDLKKCNKKSNEPMLKKVLRAFGPQRYPRDRQPIRRTQKKKKLVSPVSITADIDDLSSPSPFQTRSQKEEREKLIKKLRAENSRLKAYVKTQRRRREVKFNRS